MHYRARSYDPRTGRFAQKEPILPKRVSQHYSYVGSNPLSANDPTGQNRIVISGGISDNPPRDKHDRNWKNFITAAELRIVEDQKLLRIGETFEWFVFKPTYEARALYDGKAADAYTKEIERLATQHGAKLRWFATKEEVITLFNTTIHGLSRGKKQTGSHRYENAPLTLIASVHNYSHGVASEWTFDIFTGRAVSLGVNDISRLERSAFEASAFCESWACNTATPLQDGRTFTGEWRRHLGLPLRGVIGTTSYHPTAAISALSAEVRVQAQLLGSAITMGLFGDEDEIRERAEYDSRPHPPELDSGASWSDK
jgi:hypothetical protein